MSEQARLADRIRADGVLAPDEAAVLLLPVADALASLHAAGEVHGAVSPAAVRVDDGGRGVLLDRSAVDPDPGFSTPPSVAGSRPTAADDVWALAALLLHVTTGHPPGAYGADLIVPRTTGWLAPLIELGLRAHAPDRPSAAEAADYLRARIAPESERRRPSVVALALAGAAAITLLGIAGAALLFGGGEDDRPRTRPVTSASPSVETEEPAAAEPSTQDAPPTAAELENFARDYVATASGDPAVGFAWLTPAYQQRSPRYREVWAAIRDPRILSVTGDPAAMKVDYTYRYRLAGAGTRTERITLFLVQDGGRLLIADATAR